MLATHCTNADCTEFGVAKNVPDELADAAITCGVCSEPTTTVTEMDVAAGDSVI